MKYYSQYGQDKFLADLFKFKKNGFFLDVGAYDGKNFSNSLFFEEQLSWSGICLEPNPEVFAQLEVNRTCICLNCCAHKQKGFFRFLSITGWGSMLSGILDLFDQRHLKRIDDTINEYGGTKTIVQVEALPLHEVLDTYNVERVDYCNIDVEGGEMAVLSSIDFTKVKIEIFTIENNYNSSEVKKFLTPHGYRLIKKLGPDDVYQLNSTRYDLMIRLRIEKVRYFLSLLWRKIKKKTDNR